MSMSGGGAGCEQGSSSIKDSAMSEVKTNVNQLVRDYLEIVVALVETGILSKMARLLREGAVSQEMNPMQVLDQFFQSDPRALKRKMVENLELAGFTEQGAKAIVEEVFVRLKTPSPNSPGDEVFVDKRSAVIRSRELLRMRKSWEG